METCLAYPINHFSTNATKKPQPLDCGFSIYSTEHIGLRTAPSGLAGTVFQHLGKTVACGVGSGPALVVWALLRPPIRPRILVTS